MAVETLLSGPPSPLVTGITQIAIGSANPAALVGFYKRALGLDVLFETGGMYFLGAGGVQLMIGPNAPGAPGAGDSMFYFAPTVWAAAEAAVEAAGAKFSSPAIVLMRAEGRELALRGFKDPEGHMLALFAWRPA